MIALDKGNPTKGPIRIQEYVIFELSSWGDLMTRLIQHHVKYKEIHGLDETIPMSISEHVRLHRRLRREGKCRIPPETLREISSKARRRNPNCFAVTRLKNKEYSKNYRRILFRERIAVGIRLMEQIIYNERTGNVYISSCFTVDHRKKSLEPHILLKSL